MFGFGAPKVTAANIVSNPGVAAITAQNLQQQFLAPLVTSVRNSPNASAGQLATLFQERIASFANAHPAATSNLVTSNGRFAYSALYPRPGNQKPYLVTWHYNHHDGTYQGAVSTVEAWETNASQQSGQQLGQNLAAAGQQLGQNVSSNVQAATQNLGQGLNQVLSNPLGNAPGLQAPVNELQAAIGLNRNLAGKHYYHQRHEGLRPEVELDGQVCVYNTQRHGYDCREIDGQVYDDQYDLRYSNHHGKVYITAQSKKGHKGRKSYKSHKSHKSVKSCKSCGV